MLTVISGTSRGIGKAIAEKFLRENHEVVGLDICPSSIEDGRYTHVQCDVRDEKSLPDVKDVSVVITSAGVQLPDEDAIGVNLIGTINVVEKYAFQKDVKAVVTIASASGSTGSEFPLYAASKGGVIAYTKNVALRLAPYKATANSLSPGGVYTESNNPVLRNPKLRKEAIGESLLNKWATAEEIADFAYFLATINKSMTGQDVLVDNGEALKSNFVWTKE